MQTASYDINIHQNVVDNTIARVSDTVRVAQNNDNVPMCIESKIADQLNTELPLCPTNDALASNGKRLLPCRTGDLMSYANGEDGAVKLNVIAQNGTNASTKLCAYETNKMLNDNNELRRLQGLHG